MAIRQRAAWRGGQPTSVALSRRGALALFATAVLAPSSLSKDAISALTPAGGHLRLPPSDATVDVLHGVRIADPFRPLEDAGRADVQAWVAQEDERARALVEADFLHRDVTRFLRESERFDRAWGFRRVGHRYLATAFDGVAQQSWLELRDRPREPGTPIIDPNALRADGTLGLSAYYPDKFGTKLAYLMSENGGDAQVLRIRDLKTGGDLDDVLDGCRWTSVVWLPDSSGFHYTRPPRPGDPADWDRSSQLVFCHRLGTPQSADVVAWRLADYRNALVTLAPSQAADQIHVTAGVGTDTRNGFWTGPTHDLSQLTMLVRPGQGSFRPIRTVGSMHYAITTIGAPRGRIVKLDQTDPHTDSWQTIVPEGHGVIDGATMIANRLVVRRFEHLGHRLAIVDPTTGAKMEVPVGEMVRIGFELGDNIEGETGIEVEDRRHPRRRERLNVLTGRRESVPSHARPHDLRDVVLRRIDAVSADGTIVPVTVMHRADIVPDGTTRTLLVGYGSYGVAQWPTYSTLAAAWVRLGGVYATASTRGGGEFGAGWHEAGRGAKKQNTMDDFAAAAEGLVRQGITRPDRLGIYGASSGGRLMLASMMQRPELFGAVVAGVPVADMLRFHKLTFGVAWTHEYGNPDRPADFARLRTHSPLHNVSAHKRYPPLLLLTGDNDQRVVPAHAWKMAATLRSTVPEARVWLRTRRGCGHGTGNAHAKSIEYQADIVSFLVGQLGGARYDLPVMEVAHSSALASTPSARRTAVP